MSLTKVNIPGLHGGISQQSPHLRMQNQHTSVVNAECNLLDGIRFPRNTTVPHKGAYTEGSMGTVRTTDGKEWLLSFVASSAKLRLRNLSDPAVSATQELSTSALSYFTGATVNTLKFLNLMDSVFLLNTEKEVSTVTKAYPTITGVPHLMYKIPEVLVGQLLTLTGVLKSVNAVVGGMPADYGPVFVGAYTPVSTDTIYTVASEIGHKLCGIHTEATTFKETGWLNIVSATVTSGGNTYRAKVTHVSAAGNAPAPGGNATWTDLGASHPSRGNIPAWASGLTYSIADDFMATYPRFEWDFNSLVSMHPVDRMTTVRMPDPFGNLNLYVTTVGSYEKLPAELPFYLNNLVFSPADGYYVTWDAVKRKYIECTAPAQSVALASTKMPYRLSYNLSTGAWSLVAGEWEDYPRLVGDSDSAPLPDLIGDLGVGRKINHMFYYRNRLCFLADDFVIMSRANEPYKFFPQTATEVLDDDPISVRPSSVGYHKLLHAEPSNKQLYLFAEKKQYVLHSGYEALTPKTVALDETTSFRIVPNSVPLQIEDSILMLLNNGAHVGLLDYRLSDAEYATEGRSLTEQCPRLIPAGYNRIAYASAAKAVYVWKAGETKVYMLRMHKNTEGQLVQLAWQELEFPMPVLLLSTHYADELWVVYGPLDVVFPFGVSKMSLDKDTFVINSFFGDVSGQTLALDITYWDTTAVQLDTVTVPGTLPISRVAMVDLLSGVPCEYVSHVGRDVTFSNPMYDGAPRAVVAGFTVSPSEVELSPLVLRDDNGLPENNQAATIARLEINWTGGEFTVAMEGDAMPSRSVDIMPRSFVPGSHTPGGSYMEVEPTKVTVMYPAGRCKIKLRHKGTIPTKINNISYELDVHRK